MHSEPCKAGNGPSRTCHVMPYAIAAISSEAVLVVVVAAGKNPISHASHATFGGGSVLPPNMSSMVSISKRAVEEQSRNERLKLPASSQANLPKLHI